MGTPFRRFTHLVFVSLLLLGPATAATRSVRGEDQGHRCGTTAWGVLNALGHQAQLELQLRREARLLATGPQPAAAADVGDIAVINDDGTLVVQANAFDLANRSVRFTPDGAGYRVAARGAALDSAAAAAGVALELEDDDFREVSLGFSFVFYGRSYTSVFINSDGNLTFTAGDKATSDRDLARFLTGVPRLAPFFDDLNPAEGGRVSYTAEAGRFVVSWTEVPECCRPPAQPISTFQVSLFPNGSVEFAYGTVLARTAVVGISPGAFTGMPKIVDLSAADGSENILLPIAEVFAAQPALSETAVARKFYATHEDAYSHLVFWINFPLPLRNNAFAYELNVANSISGLGPDLGNFNFAGEFSSAGRLSSVVMMGDLSNFPSDPRQLVAGVEPNSTLSVLGQEAGHRWLVFFRYPDGKDPRSTVLLGRDNEHWSFFFNSEASVMEGNEIRDNGDGTFTTTDAVRRYGSFDQYAMGLRAPQEVSPSFVVTNSDLPLLGHTPRTGVTFRGTRTNVTIERLIETNGRRLPTAAIDQKNFRFAFVLINGQPGGPTAEQIQMLDTIRQQWEQFWTEATGGRSRADTRLLRSLSLVGLPAAVTPGAQVAVRLRAAAAATAPRTFTVTNSAPGVASVPSSVTIPAGAREIEFRAIAGTTGVSRITATASGFETAEGAIAVVVAATLQLTALSGSRQVGAPSSTLAQAVVVEARDPNALPVAGAMVRFSATGGAIVTPSTAVTDAGGRAQATVTLGPAAGPATIAASLDGFDAVRAIFTATALTPAVVPQGSAVNGASFARAPAPVSPGSIISIFGANLAAETLQASSLPLPTRLGNVTVQINNVFAPLFLVSPGQINAQAPVEISGTTATLTVNNGTSPSAPITLALAPFAPGIFTTLENGAGPGAVLHADGSLVSATSPARAGELLAIFCTGLGAVTPAAETGKPAPTARLATTLLTPQVTIGGQPAVVSFAGLAPGFVGLYQVNARVPAGLAAGPQPLVIGMILNSNTVTLMVQ